tara:strand:- start:162 stop:1019 length:858 start_codon:yes stop_codon:yes gene_type:complete
MADKFILGFPISEKTADSVLHQDGTDIGIGTNSPGAALSVVKTDADGTLSQLTTGVSDSDVRFRAHTEAWNGVLSLYDSGSNEDVRITSKNGEHSWFNNSGNVLIGTTSEPNGTSAYGSGFISQSNNRKILYSSTSLSTAQSLLLFFNPNGLIGSIQTNGSSTSYETTSDYRLKEDLEDFNGLDMISNIPVYDFKWKVDESRSYGVMAHELQEVLPQAVSGEKDATEEYEITPTVLDEEGNVSEKAVMGTRDVRQGVDYSKVVPLLIKSIQELKAEIELLKLNTP